MAKKILIVLGVLVLIFAIVLGVTTCGVMKVAEETLKEKEPQLRQYVQMTEAEQNAYVEKNMDELFVSVSAQLKNDKDMTEDKKEKMKQLRADPEAKAVGIQIGRSIVAMFIMSSDDIVKDLTPEQKASLQKESDELNKRLDLYEEFLKKYGLD